VLIIIECIALYVIARSGPQSTNCIPIPKRENNTTADQLTCQGKVIISYHLVGNERVISFNAPGIENKITLKYKPNNVNQNIYFGGYLNRK
jgi:hypothetical protein